MLPATSAAWEGRRGGAADGTLGPAMSIPDGHTLFTSESVTEGHPDKLCDQIADAVLDDVLSRDPESRVAVEAAATTGLVFVLGEMSTKTLLDVQSGRARHRPQGRLRQRATRLRL